LAIISVNINFISKEDSTMLLRVLVLFSLCWAPHVFAQGATPALAGASLSGQRLPRPNDALLLAPPQPRAALPAASQAVSTPTSGASLSIMPPTSMMGGGASAYTMTSSNAMGMNAPTGSLAATNGMAMGAIPTSPMGNAAMVGTSMPSSMGLSSGGFSAMTGTAIGYTPVSGMGSMPSSMGIMPF